MTRIASTGSYTSALSRFDKQTEELKKLLAEEEDIVSTEEEEEDESLEEAEEDDESSEEEEEEEDSSEEEEESSEEDSSDYDSEEDSDEDDSEWDSDYEDLEAVLAGGAPPPKRVNSSPALMAMDQNHPGMESPTENVLPGFINLKDRMRRQSGSYLQSPDYTTKTVPETVENPFAATRPEDHLKGILEGFSAARFPSETWHEYFLQMKDENIEGHTTAVESAIRSQDYDALRQMLRQGHTLQTCNKHGESIIHIACRRGTTELLQFLIEEAQVSTRIRDDMGRTPLHDACWTHEPNFEIVLELLRVTPELLFIVDHRGFTPLTYVPREAWGLWGDFLQGHRQFLRDMVKSLRYDRARYFIKTMVPCLKF